MLRASLLMALLLLPSLSAPSPSHAQRATIAGAVRVDGVQIIVGGLAPGPGVILILQSDVELRARLSLLRAAGESAALGPLSADLLRATQQELLGEALIASEAARLSLAVPTRERRMREHERLVVGAGGRELVLGVLARLGVTASELDAIALRRAVVSDFLDANLVGTMELTPSEVERAYKTADHPYRDRPFSEVREALHSFLAQRSLEQAVGRWVEGLKERVPHRVLVTY